MPSILAVYGKHRRLDNIRNHREAGERVPGNFMRQWRQLQEERPGLLSIPIWLAWVVTALTYP